VLRALEPQRKLTVHRQKHGRTVAAAVAAAGAAATTITTPPPRAPRRRAGMSSNFHAGCVREFETTFCCAASTRMHDLSRSGRLPTSTKSTPWIPRSLAARLQPRTPDELLSDELPADKLPTDEVLSSTQPSTRAVASPRLCTPTASSARLTNYQLAIRLWNWSYLYVRTLCSTMSKLEC
jgi:hypothetical protein